MDILKGALLFGGLAPPLGSVVVIIVMAVGDVPGDTSPLSPDDVLVSFVLVSALAYWIVGIAAVLTGMLAGALRNRLASIWARLAIMFFAALAAALSTRLHSSVETSVPFTGEGRGLDIFYAVIGCLAAWVCLKFFRPR